MDILIVDDSRSMRMLIKRCMRQAGFSGYVVEEAEDGMDGLKKLKDNSPKLILSDWNMNGMGGELFARNVCSQYPGLILGFITSESSPEINARAMATGAKFLLTKPFDAESMTAALSPYLVAV